MSIRAKKKNHNTVLNEIKTKELTLMRFFQQDGKWTLKSKIMVTSTKNNAS